MARHPGAAAIAAIVTFGLFYVMHTLSAVRDVAPPIGPAFPPLPIVDWHEPPPPAVRPPPPEPVAVAPPIETGDLQLVSLPGRDQDRPELRVGPFGPIDPPERSPGPVNAPVVLLFCPNPVYPPGPASRGIGGQVQVAFDVNRAGAPENVRVVDSEPGRFFDRAAVRAAKRCRYHPQKVEGEPVRSKDVPLLFSFDPDVKEETR